MNIPDFSKIPPNCILFVNNEIANALALMESTSNLFPEVFKLICDLDNLKEDSSIQKLFERLMSINFEIENIALMISKPISTYSTQIQKIIDFGEYEIVQIYTTLPESSDEIPRNVSPKIIKRIQPFIVPITKLFYLLPTMPKALPLLLGMDDTNEADCYSFYLNSVMNYFGHPNAKWFSLGSFSEELTNLLDSQKANNPTAAALVIDRNMISDPVFCYTDSYLDKSASESIFDALHDKNLIEMETEKGINVVTGELAKILGISQSQASYQKLVKQWKTLSNEKQWELSKIYSSLPSLFALHEKDQQKMNLQSSLLNGASLEDLIDGVTFNEYIQLIGFYACFQSTNINEKVDQAAEELEYNEDTTFVKELLNKFSTKLPKPNQNIQGIHYLPKLIESIFNSQIEIDNRITTPGAGLFGSLFGSKSNSLQGFDTIFIFVLGGISFYELSLITKMFEQVGTKKRLVIISETICTPHDFTRIIEGQFD